MLGTQRRAPRNTIRVLRRHPNFRISRMGGYLVVNFHRRFSQLFSPLSWEYTDWSDLDLIEYEAHLLCAGKYSQLSTSIARRQVEAVPAASALSGVCQ